MDQYLTTDEVAKILRTSADSVRYWRKCGTGPPGVAVGKRVLYAQDDLNRWVASLREKERNR